MRRLASFFYALNAGIVGTSLAAMLVVILALVISRYVVGTSVFWGEELARYLMFYMVNLGAALAVRHRQHPSITVIADHFKGPTSAVINGLVDVAVAVTLIIFLWQGYEMAQEEGLFSTPALRWSFFWVYLAIPIGAVASLLQLGSRLLLPEPVFGEPEAEDSLT